MRNKTKDWTDIQLIFSSVALALSIGFWGLFASREKSGAGVTSGASLPVQPDSLALAAATLAPGQKIYLGAAAPAAQANTTTTGATTSRRSHRGDGGSGGGGGGGGAAATTKSS